MVEYDEIAVLEVEAVQLVAGGFGVHDIFVDDEGGAFGVACYALADLARLNDVSRDRVTVTQYGGSGVGENGIWFERLGAKSL